MANKVKLRPNSRDYRGGGRGGEGILRESIRRGEHQIIAVPLVVIEQGGDVSAAADVLRCVDNSVFHWMGKGFHKYLFLCDDPLAELMRIKRFIEEREEGE